MQHWPRVIYLLIFTVFVFSCKKKSDPPVTNAPISCSLSVKSLEIQDTLHTISSDTAYDTGNQTRYIEFAVTPILGVSIDFNAANAGSTGNFTITSSFNEVISNGQHVYLALYKNGLTMWRKPVLSMFRGVEALLPLSFAKLFLKNRAVENKLSV
jgi:hypothetical protein